METLTIQHLLEKKYFNKATIIAGKNGLTTLIKWVHILETLEIEQLVHGNELILTTGIQLHDEEKFIRFVQHLIDKQVAGLCIELGEHIQSIPYRVKELADYHQFPILVFHEVVPFIEITKDVHSYLINQQYQMIKKLEEYGQEINRLTLHARHYEQILMRMYKYLNRHVVFFINGQTPTILPNTHREQYEKLRRQYEETGQSSHFASYDVVLLEEKYGELCIFSIDQPLHEFDLLILDRTVIALSQFLLRSLYIEETQNLESQIILEKWLDGLFNESELTVFLQQQSRKLLTAKCFAMIEQLPRGKREYDLTYYKMYIRTLFEKQGFHLFLAESKKALTYIVFDLNGHHLRERVLSCIEKMNYFKQSNHYEQFPTELAIGQIVERYTMIPQSYTTAQDTLDIRLQTDTSSYFYEDLYLQQILLQIRRNKAIMDISQNFLQPIFDYDAKNNSHLIETLRTYLQCNGQKNETAEALFIVRQTLYHRLSKIENLIGSDYMTTPKRLMIELMLLATQKSSK